MFTFLSLPVGSDTSYQNLHNNKVKNITKKNVTMLFYNKNQQLYVEKNVSGVSLGASLLQLRHKTWFPKNEATDNAAFWSITFASKCLTSAKALFSNRE